MIRIRPPGRGGAQRDEIADARFPPFDQVVIPGITVIGRVSLGNLDGVEAGEGGSPIGVERVPSTSSGSPGRTRPTDDGFMSVGMSLKPTKLPMNRRWFVVPPLGGPGAPGRLKPGVRAWSSAKPFPTVAAWLNAAILLFARLRHGVKAPGSDHFNHFTR
ncbi:MAG: hypothetical protein FJ398_21660 [Verrucomicrobia bacterium]|nr:hypothetical protein [Verrucomicrobiota bacterium]